MSTVIDAQQAFRPGRQCGPGVGQIILDLESLVLDQRAAVRASLAFVAQSLGLTAPPRELAQQAGREPIPQLLYRWIGEVDATRQAVELYQEHFERQGRFQAQLRPGAGRLLRQLGALGWEAHYLTHIGRSAAFALLDQFATEANIRSVISSVNPGSGMMRPPFLSGLLKAGQLQPQRSLLVSDHPLELAAARDLQVPALGLAYGRAPAALLAQYQPIAMARDCATVAQILQLHCSDQARRCLH